MLSWVRRHDPSAPTLLRDMESREDRALLATINEAHWPLAGLIMTDLALKTTDKARRMLMTMQETDNGIEAWRLLSHMAEGRGALRKTGMLGQILDFKFTCYYHDRAQTFRQLVRDYNRMVDVGKELDDDVQLVTLIKGAPVELKREMMARGSTWKEVGDAFDFLDEYYDRFKAFEPGKEVKPERKGGARQDAQPMEVDAMHKGKPHKGKQKGKGKGDSSDYNKGKPKGGKGKGKSKDGKGDAAKGGNGDGKIHGCCGYCGKWGHRQADCRSDPKWWCRTTSSRYCSSNIVDAHSKYIERFIVVDQQSNRCAASASIPASNVLRGTAGRHDIDDGSPPVRNDWCCAKFVETRRARRTCRFRCWSQCRTSELE